MRLSLVLTLLCVVLAVMAVPLLALVRYVLLTTGG